MESSCSNQRMSRRRKCDGVASHLPFTWWQFATRRNNKHFCMQHNVHSPSQNCKAQKVLLMVMHTQSQRRTEPWVLFPKARQRCPCNFVKRFFCFLFWQSLLTSDFMGLCGHQLQFHHRCLRKPTSPSTFVNVSPASINYYKKFPCFLTPHSTRPAQSWLSRYVHPPLPSTLFSALPTVTQS